MDEWEAKYKALVAGITDERMIENAERLVNDAKEIAAKSGVSFEWVFEGVLREATKKKKLLGFPIIVGDWLPSDHAMIFGHFGAVITNFRTGETRVASKEDMERVVSKFFAEEKGGDA